MGKRALEFGCSTVSGIKDLGFLRLSLQLSSSSPHLPLSTHTHTHTHLPKMTSISQPAPRHEFAFANTTDAAGQVTDPYAPTTQAFVGNEPPTAENNEEIGCRRGAVKRFLGTMLRFFKTLIGKKPEEEDEAIPVVSLSSLGSAGSDEAEPQPVAQPPVRTSCGNEVCAIDSFSRTPFPTSFAQRNMAGGYACPADQMKMARVVEWLSQSDGGISKDNAGSITVQPSDVECDSSVPWPPSALSDDEEEELTPFQANGGCFLVNEAEDASRARMFSLKRISRALGIRPRAARDRASIRRGTHRQGGMFRRMPRLGATSQ